MLVTLIKNDYINMMTLPIKVSGQYWVKDTRENTNNFELISIEGINEKWILKSNKNVKIYDETNTFLKTVSLEPLSFYNIEIIGCKERAIIFVEPITDNRQVYTKMSIEEGTTIKIGRSNSIDNDIVYANRFVSATHAHVSYTNGSWKIEDKDSTNGTFVNGYRTSEKLLVPGDTIYIMGLKIILGKDFLAYNNPDDRVVLMSDKLKKFPLKQADTTADEDYELNPMDYFYRSPRFKRDIEKAVFKIDSPPQSNKGEETPFILLIGPSITMGMASMTTGIFAVNNALANGNVKAAVPSIVMSFSMLLGTILWPMVSKRYEKKRKNEKEIIRQQKYKQYLEDMSEKIKQECLKQEAILRENYISVTECVDRIKSVHRNLWERSYGQNDFLRLRLGLGNTPLIADIQYSERKFTIDNDNLQEELLKLCETPKVLENIPITLSLYDSCISGVIGDKKITKEFAKSLIFQMASLYSYDEVKLVFVYDEDDSKDYDFVKWLPHVWNNEKNIRLIATNNNELKEVSVFLEKEVEIRANLNESDLEDVTPYYIIISLSKKLADRAEMMKQIYANKKNIHMSVITFYDELKNLPKECATVVELEAGQGKLYSKNDISGQYVSFTPDENIKTNTLELSVMLSNIYLDTLANSYKLPSTYTFLEMYGVGKVEHMNARTRWKENDPTKSLEASVGVDELGEPFKLDLHEKFHGPHGLVAGMTGSGKSEFIITYILSLAVNYHPNEVAFILIDYKGGGMAKAFETLPHTAGIITNLDGAAVKRSLISIESELKRRQTIFADSSKKLNISNIDIYKYQKLYREKKVSEPLPHLFIISDEFAELKTQQPEFMTQLISAARIGRSLGVHLILATQKPAGVVDDQIWSNSKFRICLKVQERSDSMDMLKRPDAAELTQTGRFYLQVGYNELFEIGQSGWAGATYYPSDRVITEKDNSVIVIDKIGHVVKQAKVDKRKSLLANPKKQLDVITDYLCDIAKEEGIKTRQLWLEPIPGIIYLKELKDKYPEVITEKYILNPIIGEYDDPSRQQQCPLMLPLSREGNAVIYGVSGSGKTTFINTMIYSLLQEHTPDEVNLYLLDFASETLKAFSKAPHVGDVILSYETEKVNNLFKLLYSEIEKRKKTFADFGGDYQSYLTSEGVSIPSIVVVINNYSAFMELFEDKEEAVSYMTREGTKYGIYFVLTAVGTGVVRFRLLQNFKQLFVLQLNDSSDYSTVVGKTDGLVPSKFKGRGLVKLDQIYEFQTANITDKDMLYRNIQDFCKELHTVWAGSTAKKIPILPELVNLEFIGEYYNPVRPLIIPIGVEKSSLEVHYYPFDNSYINFILAANNEHNAFTYSLIKLISEKGNFDVTVIDSMQTFITENNSLFHYHAKVNELEECVSDLFDVILYRNNLIKEAEEKGVTVEAFEQKIIFINSIADLKEKLSDKGKEKLNLILEKGEIRFNCSVVISETVKKLNLLTYDKWFKNRITQTDGIWVGSGIADQYQLKVTKSGTNLHDEITEEFGYAVERGKPVKIKLLNVYQEEE